MFLRTPLSLCVLASMSAGCASAAEPDPIQLLRDAAKAVGDAESVEVDFVPKTTIVREGVPDVVSGEFSFRTAPGGRFEFVSVNPKGGDPVAGYRVAGNDRVVLTHMIGQRRHMLAERVDGFADYVRSPGARGIGNGLGGLALSFLDPAAIEDIVASVGSSRFVGVEEVDGEELLHAKYVLLDGMPVDVWYRAEGAPLVRRVSPYVLNSPGVQQMARRFKSFDYRLDYEFNNWNTKAGHNADDVRVIEPTNSSLMASLYKPPSPPPYHMLGKTAPTFELTALDGATEGLGDPDGDGAVLLEFWAVSCPVCVKLMPELEKLHEEYASRGLDYYAINVNDTSDRVAAFMDRRGWKVNALIDDQDEVAMAYGVGPLPLVLLVGPDGRIQYANVGAGAATSEKLAEFIEATLRGEDVAGRQLDEAQRKMQAQIAERERLRSLLDG